MDKITRVPASESRRMQLRGMVLLSSEIISNYWPMRNFVHHNPLHNLEYLSFEDAVSEGKRLLGGKGYLSAETFRGYVRSGRIRSDDIDAALRTIVGKEHVVIGGRHVSRLDVVRAHLVKGITAPGKEILDAQVKRSPDRKLIRTLADYLGPALNPEKNPENFPTGVDGEQATFKLGSTLAAWCDAALGSQIMVQINREMIKWCEAFLDEGHATWSMPGRERSFFGSWKFLAQKEWSVCGISESRRKIAGLPVSPEDALLEHLRVLGIPIVHWKDYFTLHLASLPGWAGFIKWRADQNDYEWQQAYPIDLVQYLAVRIWYERELVQKVTRDKLGIDAQFDLMATDKERKVNFEPKSGRSKGREEDFIKDGVTPSAFKTAWCLLSLAKELEIDPEVLMKTAPGTLMVLQKWLEDFPESQHGPVWLKAFERGYQERLVGKLELNLSKLQKESHENLERQREVRPQAQAVFCIDIRSESFRRHLEAVGDFETFGFAGFFTVFIRFRALGSNHDTYQFPVIMKAKNAVREVPRTFQGQMLTRHRLGAKILHTGHEVLHDLKENMVTPYVTVESVGWFYSIPLVGKTLFAESYRRWTERIKRIFVPPVATSLSVEKLSREEVTEMIAAEQRATIRQALRQRFGDRELNLSLERLEELRLRALDERGGNVPPPRNPSSYYALTSEEELAFVTELRDYYRINHGGAFSRMERITQLGFTLSEQVFTAETALRMMGLTRRFSRLVLFCGHHSTSENNPFEAALDCGACGGNGGKPNARVLAMMVNKTQVREQLAKNGIVIPQDTFFIAGQHNTVTDEVELYDLEDLPPTHFNDLLRLSRDLKEAGHRNSRERCIRFPEINQRLAPARASREAQRRSGDWSQVRPEWGLSGNAAFILGRRELTRGIDLEGRVFLHSYDYRQDPTGRFLEIAMTAPQVVGQWINMEHYFSTVDNEVYGSGDKIYHNVVGRFGIMSGPQSDLRTGLASQTVMERLQPYHEAMRMLTIIEAPRERVRLIISRHKLLSQYYDNGWVRLIVLDPEEKIFYFYIPRQEWEPIKNGMPTP